MVFFLVVKQNLWHQGKAVRQLSQVLSIVSCFHCAHNVFSIHWINACGIIFIRSIVWRKYKFTIITEKADSMDNLRSFENLI